MPMIYMINAVFDAADSVESTNGRFLPPPGPQAPLPGVLLQSLMWLKQSDPTNANPGPDTVGDWIADPLATGTHLQLALRDQVWVRVCAAAIDDYYARITTVITRHVKGATAGTDGAFQQRASPFPLDGTSRSCVVFDTGNQLQSDSGSWVQKLGTATFTTSSTGDDCYRMIVAATVGSSTGGEQVLSDVRTYSHDPEFDVDGGG
jgi:hypothetical protein